MRVRIYYSHLCLDHLTGPHHPECPERLRTLLDLFHEEPFCNWPLIQASEADYDYILQAHDAAYLDRLEDIIPDRDFSWFDQDTILSPRSLDAALHAAGCARQAVDDVMKGDLTRAFCAIRPPGHHAMPDRAMGFCLFNNIFLAALHAQKRYGLQRIAIADFDVHYGNGSDAMARRHPGIFFTSSHEWPLYTLTGEPGEDVPGRVLNVALAAGDGSKEFRAAWETRILPQLDAFAPELLLISAGFDAHRRDPLSNINLEDEDFAWITEKLVEIANRHAGGRVVSVLEGGYDLAALTSGVAAHLQALAL